MHENSTIRRRLIEDLKHLHERCLNLISEGYISIEFQLKYKKMGVPIKRR